MKWRDDILRRRDFLKNIKDEEYEDDEKYLKMQRHKAKSSAITSRVYNDVILDLAKAGKEILDKELISKEYIKRVCQLPTEDLEFIKTTSYIRLCYP